MICGNYSVFTIIVNLYILMSMANAKMYAILTKKHQKTEI